MLKEFKADLHIHTCLSPCGDLKMSPKAIVEEAEKKGLDIIGVCDHNSAENIKVAIKVASGTKVNILAGMEVTSAEEAHLVALFDGPEQALELQDIVYANLLPGENDESIFGYQVVVNELDEVEDLNKRLLIGATTLTLDKSVEIIHSLGGLAIASHIDKESFSIIGQLGVIPEGLELDALEISPHMNREEAKTKFSQYSDYPLISSSDAHFLEDIGKKSTVFLLKEAKIGEIRKAFGNVEGRRILS
ncbi:MAG: PHP domain-containing protein [Deltaproteobacteria bacterium]|nr:MAG: PHP domain-containing protein [Deltaproteobacteria bacterium]